MSVPANELLGAQPMLLYLQRWRPAGWILVGTECWWRNEELFSVIGQAPGRFSVFRASRVVFYRSLVASPHWVPIKVVNLARLVSGMTQATAICFEFCVTILLTLIKVRLLLFSVDRFQLRIGHDRDRFTANRTNYIEFGQAYHADLDHNFDPVEPQKPQALWPRPPAVIFGFTRTEKRLDMRGMRVGWTLTVLDTITS